ncbi:MAG: hypothetical protein AAF333_05485 [Planctomycetota bacterium]
MAFRAWVRTASLLCMVIGGVVPIGAGAQVTAIDLVPVDNSLGGPAFDNLVTTDIVQDFSGQWTGSQLMLEMSSGVLYRDPPPATPFDTMLYLGSLNDPAPEAPVSIGLPLDLLPPTDPLPPITTHITELNLAWFPPSSDGPILDRSDFLTARFTFSQDATGTFTYLTSANGEITVLSGFIVNGALVPEPRGLAVVALAGCATLSRRQGARAHRVAV